MANKKYAQKKAEQFIRTDCEGLVVFYQKALAWSEKLKASTKAFTDFISCNEEFEDMCGDSRGRSRMVLMIGLLILAILVDSMLTYHALDILCATIGLPTIYKYIAPIMLVILEVLISYISFTAIYQREGRDRVSGLTRFLPYSVLIIIIGFSLSVIVYLLLNFGSMPMFSILTIIVQGILLIASILLHLLIIRNSLVIGEMFAFGQYLIKRKSLVGKTEQDQKGYDVRKNVFTKECGMLERDIYEFNKEFLNNTVDFTVGIPIEVVAAANRVMGRDVFRRNNSFHAQIPD